MGKTYYTKPKTGKQGVPPSAPGVSIQQPGETVRPVVQTGAAQAAPQANTAPKANAATTTYSTTTVRPGVSAETQAALSGYEGGYKPGEGVTSAQAYFQELMGQKPGAYESPYAQQMSDLYDKIAGRQPFKYDLNADALYKQYRDQYAQMGRTAMMDTMGQAAGLTGGYGSSYSQAAGQQAYDSYLQQLNDRVPELYQLALSKYQAEGDDLLKQYGLLNDRESTEYGRWRDQVGDWRSDVAQAYQRYGDERNFDYNTWSDMLGYWMNKANQENSDWWKDTEWQHQLEREGVEDERYNTEWQHQLDREAVSDSQWERQFAASQAARAANTKDVYDDAYDAAWKAFLEKYQHGVEGYETVPGTNQGRVYIEGYGTVSIPQYDQMVAAGMLGDYTTKYVKNKQTGQMEVVIVPSGPLYKKPISGDIDTIM